MASNATAKECGVCNEEFDEMARCPRTFQCLHTLCTSCIDRLISNNAKQCPYCRRNFRANCSKDVAVNHLAIELIKYFSPHNSSIEMSHRDRVLPRKARIGNLKKETRETSSFHLINCLEAQRQIEKNIRDLRIVQENIKQGNTKIENDVLPRIQNIISQNNRIVAKLERTKIKLQNQLTEVKVKSKELENVKGNLDSCRANTFSESGTLLDKAEETNTAIGCWMETFTGLISEEEKNLHATNKTVKRIREKIEIIFEVLSSGEERDEEEIGLIPGMAAMAIQEDNVPTQIAPETLREMRPQVKHLVEQGRVYALQRHEGRTRTARISYTENENLCLHHLREEPLPPNVLVVDHWDVMRLVNPLSRLTFLDLDAGGTTLGRLYIRLCPDTKRAKQFSFLCTGEVGPSYANTNILALEYKGHDKEWVRGGDYEMNNGEGGKEVVPGVVGEEWGDEYKRQWLAGTVAGLWGYGRGYATAAQFVIKTRDSPGSVFDYSFGMVEEGLSVLTEAILHYPNITEVSIKDCGIVLPC